MSHKLPAIQWYPNDWQNDIGVQSLDWEPRAIWWEILQRMHQTESRGRMVLNGRPMTHEEIANIIHCEIAKFKQALEQIISKGVASIDAAGVLINRRMVSDERLRSIRAEAGSQGGKQKASNAKAKGQAKSTPSTSSSTGPSAPLQSSPSTTERPRQAKKTFQKPTLEQLKNYAAEIGFTGFKADRFLQRYDANGWMVTHRGKTKPMENWKLTVQTWRTIEERSEGNKQRMEQIIKGGGAVDLE